MVTEMVVAPVVLEGQHVRLEPLQKNHLAGLAAVGLDPELWRWIPTPVRTNEEMAAYIETALREQEQAASLPFALVERQAGRPIGSTRYCNIERAHRRVEIGWTWVGREWQRTATNTEAKYLLLKHAFETLGCLRVELKTDSLNERARGNSADWSPRRRYLPESHDHCERAHPPYGLLQHCRFRMARCEGPPRGNAEFCAAMMRRFSALSLTQRPPITLALQVSFAR
jgi:N-acetyltransferase